MQKKSPLLLFQKRREKNNQIMIVNHLTNNSLIAIIGTKMNM
mgnify:CR=1 FL=1